MTTNTRKDSKTSADVCAVPGSTEPGHCPRCVLLAVQLREVLEAENSLPLWEMLDNLTTHKEYGHWHGARPPQ